MFKKYASNIASISTGTVGVMGIPFDAYSSFLRGASLAPARVRETFYSDSSNLCAENGFCLSDNPRWTDIGDLHITSTASAMQDIERGCSEVLERGGKLMAIGGDHSITYPILRAYARKYRHLNILHLDAHADIYDEYDGNRYSHACPFARIMEEKLASQLSQIGIRTLTPHLREQAERYGVRMIEMRHWTPDMKLEFSGPIYLSLDMDVLDPAFAPGVSHHEPGGFSTREVVDMIQTLKGQIVGADIVEFNPTRDPTGVTGMVVVKLMKEIMARILGS